MLKEISEALAPVIAEGRLEMFIDKGKLIHTSIKTNAGEILVSIRKSNGSTGILGYKDAVSGVKHFFGYHEELSFNITDSENVVETLEMQLEIAKADAKNQQDREQDQAAHRE
ncbi:hypothetical protein phiOC_p199 [Ochrobactrum phage vB_OspM_OC]|nr:hypothetical protein phiOC_p199 [Ochrobactrum phage vB_OspM_OC]